jgi:hypothetical protein
MPSRVVLRPLCLAGCLAAVWFLASEHPSDARPNYKKCFDTVFEDIAKKNKTNCAVCHFGDDKKHLNHFGKAVAEELGEKLVKDDEKIIAAIKRAAKRKCKTGDWSERLEKGLPPCTCRSDEHRSEAAQR